MISAVMLLTGTTLTVLSLTMGNTRMMTPLFIVMPLTFALHALSLYAGWGDDRSGSPARYYASRGYS